MSDRGRARAVRRAPARVQPREPRRVRGRAPAAVRRRGASRACRTTRLASGFLTGKYRPGGAEVESPRAESAAKPPRRRARGARRARRGRRRPLDDGRGGRAGVASRPARGDRADRERPLAGAARRAPADGRRSSCARTELDRLDERPRGGIGGPSREQGRAPPARHCRGHERASRLARLPPARDRRADLGDRHPGHAGRAPVPGVRAHGVILPRRHDRARRAGAARRRRAARRHAGRPHRPPPAPARRPSSCRPRPPLAWSSARPPGRRRWRCSTSSPRLPRGPPPSTGRRVRPWCRPSSGLSGCGRPISFNYGLVQVAMVVGPAVGGIIIAAAGLKWAYADRRRDVHGDDRRGVGHRHAAVACGRAGRVVPGGRPRRHTVRRPEAASSWEASQLTSSR